MFLSPLPSGQGSFYKHKCLSFVKKYINTMNTDEGEEEQEHLKTKEKCVWSQFL